jgi:Uma2 family endonuclease
MMTMSLAGVGRPFSVADLEAMPDDGRRYELIDGELLVTPAPGWAHQEASITLTELLRAACPRDLRVLIAPFAVRPDMHNEFLPDVLVARFADLTLKNLPKPPVLAVEVASPSSRLTDANLKRAVYARMGVQTFWLVDPDPEQPSLTAFELAAADYRQVAHLVGDQVFSAERPFAVRIMPAELVRGLQP